MALGTENPGEVFEDISERGNLEEWLNAPLNRKAIQKAEQSLVRYLEGA